jgi:hypothetical protein
MKKIIKILGFIMVLNACATPLPPPAPFTQIETKKTVYPLGVIGQTEPIYFPPMKSPFIARIDTGAERSSIDVRGERHFERDGEKWVAFVLTNRVTGESHRFEKRIKRHTTIKRIDEDERRVVVNMDVKMGGQYLNTSFSLANRERFEYQALVGRNILTGRAIVDTALFNTLE